MFEAHPLMAFAPLMEMQVRSLDEMAGAIEETLDASFTGGSNVDGALMSKVYGLIWLWVLGVYEVLRTMCQAKECFSQSLGEQLCSQKRYFAKLRMPLQNMNLNVKKGCLALRACFLESTLSVKT
nr:hypothetical protein [uncultured Halomonas sp.]